MKLTRTFKKFTALLLASLVAAQPLLASAQSAYQFRRALSGLYVTHGAGAPIGTGAGGSTAAPQPRLEVSALSVSFGTQVLGTVKSEAVAVLNSGDAPLSFIESPGVVGSAAFDVSTNCPSQLSPGESCVLNITYHPVAAGVQTAAIQLRTNAGLQTINLAGTGIASALALNAGFNGAFGNLTVGTSSNITVTASNVSPSTISGLYAKLEGPPSLTIVSSSCGQEGSPIALASGATCQVVVRWAPSQASSVNGAQLKFFGAYANAPAAVGFSGTAGGFDAAGAWSSAAGSTVAPANNTLHFGAQTAGLVARTETIFLRNTGSNGALTAAFRLEGDTQHFSIQAVRMVTSSGSEWACDLGGAVQSGGLSTSECGARDPNNSLYNHIQLTVRYAPGAIGSHSVRLIPTSTHGAAMPEPLTLTGVGEFNPTGEWSTASGATALSSPLDLGTVFLGTTNDHIVYLRNSGTNGALSAGFSLTGDTGHYRIVAVGVATDSGSGFSCASGGVIASDGFSASPCVAYDPGSGSHYKHIYVRLRYTPTATGQHSVQLAAVSTTNGSTLPVSPVTLRASSVYDANGVWSMHTATTTAPSSADLSFSTTTAEAQERTFTMRNTGSLGPLSVGFALTGDTAHYRITKVQMAHSNGSLWTCVSGGVIAADGLSSTPCTAQNPTGGNGYVHVRVTVSYQPQAAGTHTVSLVPSSPLPATLPGSLTITGEYTTQTQTDTGGAPTNSPTANIWAPSGLTLSTTDLFSASRTSLGGGTSRIALPSTGKWYFEVRFTSGTSLIGVGVAPATNYPGGYPGSCAYYPHLNSVYRNGSNTGANTGGGTTGNVVGVAWNADTKTVTFSRGGLQGTRPCTLAQSGPFYAAIGQGSTGVSGTFTYIDNPSQFVNPVPSGYQVPNLRP